MSDSSKSEWVCVGDVGDMPETGVMEAVVDGRILAIIHAKEAWHALDGTCPHHGGPLGQGTIQDECLVCPWHGLPVAYADGAYTLGTPDRLPCHDIRIDNQTILVRLRHA